MRDMPVARSVGAVALTFAFALTGATAQAEAPFSFAATPGKLPKDVIPLQYAAHIVTDVAGNSFRGSQTVEIEVLSATKPSCSMPTSCRSAWRRSAARASASWR